MSISSFTLAEPALAELARRGSTGKPPPKRRIVIAKNDGEAVPEAR